jgi:hypothetical protein
MNEAETKTKKRPNFWHILAEHLFDVNLLRLAKVPAMLDLLASTFDSWNVHLFTPPPADSLHSLNSHGVI